MSHLYRYKCTHCQKEFSPADIEPNFHYLCPSCGTAEKNQPLKGVLKILYDYSRIRQKKSRKQFLTLLPGQLWLYPELWPLERDNSASGLKGLSPFQLKNVALPSQSLLQFHHEGQNVLLMDDTRNPTYSYKDRASILVALKAIQMGIREIAAASTGNAGSSLAGICARLGLTARIWVPENIPDAKLLQIQSYGAQVHLVKGDYDAAFDLSLEIGQQKGWYNRNTAYNPLTIEGKKWAAFDLFLQTAGNLPDPIFVPVGDGVIIAGVYKGLWELQQLGWLEQLPRLVAVQSTGSDALVRYLATGRFEYRPAHTLADSISAGAPRNLYLAAEAVRNTGGTALAVTDQEILQAQQLLARHMGLLVEPASAAAFAGYLKWVNNEPGSIENHPLVLLTGSGLKDVSALQSWNTRPPAYSPTTWKEKLLP